MSITQDPISAEPAAANGAATAPAVKPAHETTQSIATTTLTAEPAPVQAESQTKPPKASLDTTSVSSSMDPTDDFTGDVETDNTLPSKEMLKRVENVIVLDKDGKGVPFKSVYTGPNVPRRVLVIFIRHFFCGVSFPSLAATRGWRRCLQLTNPFSTELSRVPSHTLPIHNT